LPALLPTLAAFLDMLLKNKTLKALYLDGDSIGEKVTQTHSLTHNSTLQILVLTEKYWTYIATGVTNRIAYIGPCPVSSDKRPTWPATTLPVN